MFYAIAVVAVSVTQVVLDAVVVVVVAFTAAVIVVVVVVTVIIVASHTELCDRCVCTCGHVALVW